MSFNLKRAKKSKRPLQRLRSLSDDCAGLRPSDLDGMSEKEMHNFFYSVKSAQSQGETKVAIHGNGDTFFPVGNDYNPYKTSPLVNNPGPEFGGRWRRDFPGSGDQHINDDADKKKDGKGNGDDNDPHAQKERVNDLLSKIKGPKYVVRMRLAEEDEPSEEKARSIFGEGGQTDGKSVYVIIDGYEAALKLQRKVPGAVIEPKGV